MTYIEASSDIFSAWKLIGLQYKACMVREIYCFSSRGLKLLHSAGHPTLSCQMHRLWQKILAVVGSQEERERWCLGTFKCLRTNKSQKPNDPHKIRTVCGKNVLFLVFFARNCNTHPSISLWFYNQTHSHCRIYFLQLNDDFGLDTLKKLCRHSIVPVNHYCLCRNICSRAIPSLKWGFSLISWNFYFVSVPFRIRILPLVLHACNFGAKG